METTTDRVSVVLIPAYQPRDILIESANALRGAGFVIVVVDDGSGADYQPLFVALDESVHLVRHEHNRGKGAALKTGLAYIQRTFQNYLVITADADGQHAPADIENMARTYRRHPHTLLLGSRTFEAGDVPLKSKFGNVLTRRVFSLITRQQLRDTQTGLRAFDESLIDFMLNVPGERFEYEMNMLLECARGGIEIVELPIQTIYKNGNESSHFDPIKDSLSIYGQIIKFASSSLAAFVIDYAVFLLLVHITSSWALAASVMFANIAARCISASFNFAVNKHLVFRHKGSLAKSLLSYALLAAGILTANTLLLALLVSGLGIAAYAAKIAVEVVLFVASYTVQKHAVFAHRRGEVR